MLAHVIVGREAQLGGSVQPGPVGEEGWKAQGDERWDFQSLPGTRPLARARCQHLARCHLVAAVHSNPGSFAACAPTTRLGLTGDVESCSDAVHALEARRVDSLHGHGHAYAWLGARQVGGRRATNVVHDSGIGVTRCAASRELHRSPGCTRRQVGACDDRWHGACLLGRCAAVVRRRVPRGLALRQRPRSVERPCNAGNRNKQAVPGAWGQACTHMSGCRRTTRRSSTGAGLGRWGTPTPAACYLQQGMLPRP